MKKNLFIIESNIGIHHAVDNRLDADILSFTFLPMINSKKDEDSCYSYLMPQKINPLKLNGIQIEVENLAFFIKEANYNLIFIGTDLDITGNYTARIIHDYLIKNIHLSSNRLIRIPLTSEGFKYVSNFWDDNFMEFWLSNTIEEMEFVQHSKQVLGRHGVGRRFPLILHGIEQAPEEVENINPNGTSSVTYLFKKSIKEK